MKDEKQRELLREVVRARLEAVLESNADEEGVQEAFDQAMEAIDRDIEIAKIEASKEELLVKKEQLKKEGRREIAIRCVEIGAATVIAPIVYYCTNKGFARLICEFEKNDYFSCSAGKSLSKLFKFGK